MHDHAEPRPFVPAMGVGPLLPFYDIIARLAGAATLHNAVVAAAELHPGMRVLDVGCGTGSLVITTRRRHPDVEVVGIDPDERALHRARRKARRAGLAVRFDHGYAQELPYPDASFERLLSSLMLHHVETSAQAAMFAEMRRVLVPGGQLVLADIARPVGPHALFGRLRRSNNHRRSHDHGQWGGLDALPDQLARARFAATTELHPVTTRLGRIRLFRATEATQPGSAGPCACRRSRA